MSDASGPSSPSKQPGDAIAVPFDQGSMDEDGGEFGGFDMEDMFDPLQQFGGLFVTQNEKTGANETIAEILADIRNSLAQGVKILYHAHHKK